MPTLRLKLSKQMRRVGGQKSIASRKTARLLQDHCGRIALDSCAPEKLTTIDAFATRMGLSPLSPFVLLRMDATAAHGFRQLATWIKAAKSCLKTDFEWVVSC
jgi:hypothetical protein